MKFLVSAVFAFCVLEVPIAASTDADVIKAKIAQEEAFLISQISDTKATIASTISSKRSTLNSRADYIMDEIMDENRSPPRCHVWLEHFESIKRTMINFIYQFQRCEESSRLIKLKGDNQSAFRDLNRSADTVEVSCIIKPYTCQSQINGLVNLLDLIHGRIVSDISSIKADSERCVNDRGNSISQSLESAYTSFQKCKYVVVVIYLCLLINKNA